MILRFSGAKAEPTSLTVRCLPFRAELTSAGASGHQHHAKLQEVKCFHRKSRLFCREKVITSITRVTPNNIHLTFLPFPWYYIKVSLIYTRTRGESCPVLFCWWPNFTLPDLFSNWFSKTFPKGSWLFFYFFHTSHLIYLHSLHRAAAVLPPRELIFNSKRGIFSSSYPKRPEDAWLWFAAVRQAGMKAMCTASKPLRYWVPPAVW